MTSTNYLKAKETCGHLLLGDAEQWEFTLNVPILPQNAAEVLPEIGAEHLLDQGLPGPSSHFGDLGPV